MNRLSVVIIAFFPILLSAQSFEPCADEPGTNAIHKDSNVIVAWATSSVITRGYMDFLEPSLGFSSQGVPDDALGPADGASVISLGDRGEAVLQFAAPITNGPGPDFAVFENGFIDGYMEFAFVEVSSDGVNYVRFPAVSEIPTDLQASNFTINDCGFVNNLAGKYSANYGTPFDLEELVGIEGLNTDQITHVKLIDVIGTIDPLHGSLDENGNLINDPYPTAFPSGGFDLDGVAVIHQGSLDLNRLDQNHFRVYPNPFQSYLTICGSNGFQYRITDLNGCAVLIGSGKNMEIIDCNSLSPGVYIVGVYVEGFERFYRVLK